MKILIIILLGYVLLVLTGRYLFPAILKYYLKRFSKRFYNGMNMASHDYNAGKEGEISINKQEEKTKRKSSEIGEYVDYEEIK